MDKCGVTDVFCPACDKYKSQVEFGRNKARKNGLQSYCSICTKEYLTAYRKKNAARIAFKASEYVKKHAEKVLEMKRQYRRRHPDKVAAYKKEYTVKNRDAIKTAWRAYYRKNAEIILQKNREWATVNKDKIAEYCRRRNHRLRSSKGEFTSAEWDALCAVFNDRCLDCGQKAKLTVDHVIPLSQGGTNLIANIQPLCLSCNSSKATKAIDYRLPWKQVPESQ